MQYLNIRRWRAVDLAYDSWKSKVFLLKGVKTLVAVKFMLTALVETFGRELKIKDKEIGEYLAESGFSIQSPSFPFKSIEPMTHLIIVSQTKEVSPKDSIYLGYWIGNADVPSIPTILIGEPKNIPTVIRRSLKNLFCSEEDNLESVLKPLIASFSKLIDILEKASGLKIDGRIKLREQLITETLKIMKTLKYNIEEYKEECKERL